MFTPILWLIGYDAWPIESDRTRRTRRTRRTDMTKPVGCYNT